MSRTMVFNILAACLLIGLVGLYLVFGGLKREQESTIAKNSGDDEMSQVIRAEADEYRRMNALQQKGLLATGVVVGVAALAWNLRRGKVEETHTTQPTH